MFSGSANRPRWWLPRQDYALGVGVFVVRGLLLCGWVLLGVYAIDGANGSQGYVYPLEVGKSRKVLVRTETRRTSGTLDIRGTILRYQSENWIWTGFTYSNDKTRCSTLF